MAVSLRVGCGAECSPVKQTTLPSEQVQTLVVDLCEIKKIPECPIGSTPVDSRVANPCPIGLGKTW
jgi:hypothetical protein